MGRQDVKFRIVEGDALTVESDVLLLKYAQKPYGLDKIVISKLEKVMVNISDMLPAPGKHIIIEAFGITSVARKIMFVGVNHLYTFQYKDIRKFAYLSLKALSESLPAVRHLSVTIHGVNYGLDEEETLKAQIAGFIDAIDTDNAPPMLSLISIVERSKSRADRLSMTLDGIFQGANTIRNVYAENLKSVGDQSNLKPHVFVAMPFMEDMDDVYHYGIQRAVHGNGLLCERADLSSFTGDIIDWVKGRISSSSMVIAETSSPQGSGGLTRMASAVIRNKARTFIRGRHG